MIYELERAPDARPVEASSQPDTKLAKSPDFRACDFLLGSWAGERVAAACGTSVAIDLEAEAILGGTAIVVETRVSDPGVSPAAADSYAVLGYEPGRQRWVRYAVEVGHPGLVRQEGRSRGQGIVLAGKPGPGSGGSGCRQRWTQPGPDQVVCICERRALGEDAWETCWRQELRRVP